MIRKMIKVDLSTSIYDKGRFARICVEIDLKKPLVPTYMVFGDERPIIYEGLHHVCFACGKYGHQKSECPLNEEQDKAHSQEHGHADVGAGVTEVRHRKRKGFNKTNQQAVAQSYKEELSDSRRISRKKDGALGYWENKGELTKLKGQAKVEWVQVGSKRKNMGKGQNKGKENIPPANRSAYSTIMGHGLEPNSSNSFKVLQGLAVQDNPADRDTCDKSNLGLETVHVVPNAFNRDTEMLMSGSLSPQSEMILGALEDNNRFLNTGSTHNHQLEQASCDQDMALGEVELPQHQPFVSQ
ncbi:hypothetical protein K1719_024935 [Acacia pycnantha]|nr:hypothetical protein K1719_024935 [Acacia pycnantha]